MPASDESNRESEFWGWFSAHETSLLAAEDPDADVLQELTAHLDRVHQGLVWELGAPGAPPRDLTISADGIVDNAFAVDALCDAAPPLANWRIIRFRPRVPEEVYRAARLQYDDLVIDAAKTQAALFPEDDGLVSVFLFLPGRIDAASESASGAAFILLDMALGEYDVMCKVAEIAIAPTRDPAPRGVKKIPYTRLRAEFDALFESLQPG